MMCRSILLISVVIAAIGAAMQAQSPAQLFGTWRGTSTCTDRVLAPGCNDEIAVYEFKAGSKPGTVLWIADKVVNGQRQNMGELDMTYDKAESCWSVEINTPRVHDVWCLSANGAQLTGTLRQLPGKQIIRKVSLKKD